MALKKPSDLFNRKESSVVFTSQEVSAEITETYDRFRDNLDKVNVLSEKIEQLSQQLSEKLNKTDLENAMLSQLMVLDENFKSIQNQVKGLNKEDLKEFREKVTSITEIVGELIEEELPRYKKQINNNEIRIGEKFDSFKGSVDENISNIRNDIDDKINNIAEVVDNNLEYLNNQLQETSSEVKKTTDTYNKLSKIVESKVSRENEKLEEYSKTIQSLYEAFVELESFLKEETSIHQQVVKEIIEKQFENISAEVKNQIDEIDEEVDNIKNKVSSDISNIKADVVINEQHLKKVETYIQENHKEIVDLRDEVFEEIDQIPIGNIQENIDRIEKKIDFIRETYSKIEPEVIVKEVIKEGLLNEPSETKNEDPLTPLNQNFVTLDQLQEHYRLFINRIQQQLSTLGGGGETQLKYLDDIVGIATNASTYNGKYLKYDHSIEKFVFDSVDITSDTWVDGVSGAYTNANVGIGTINPQSILDVRGTISIGRTDIVGINSIFSNIEINSWEHIGVSKSVGTEDATPQDIYFKSDGTKMFMLGSTNDRVYEYALSLAWDVSTAGFTTYYSITAQETTPLGLYFSPNGLNMYVCGSNGVAPLVASGDYVHQYTLGTAWNISNTGGATVGWTTSYRILDDTSPQAVYLKDDDGTKMYVVGTTNDRIYEYVLGTPWNVSTAGLSTSVLIGTGTTQGLPLTLTGPTGINFNTSGTQMYITDTTRDVIARFDLSTAWDLNTAVFHDQVYVGFQDFTPNGIFYQENQSKAYVVGDSSNIVYQYNTDTPSIELASSGISTRSSVIINNEARLNNKLYVTGDSHFSSPVTLKSSLQVDSSIATSSNLTVSGGTITAGNIAATLLSGNTTTNISFGTGLTSGTLTVGGSSQTGFTSIGISTLTHILNIASGASGSGVSKFVNIATGGASGSRTLLTLGSSTAGSIGTVFIPSSNIGIGTATPTSSLHVVGSAIITGITTVGVANTSTPPSNSQMSFELITNTQLRIKVRGTDGVLRSADITLA